MNYRFLSSVAARGRTKPGPGLLGMTRRSFLASMAATGPVVTSCQRAVAATTPPLLSFGLMADAQYVDAPAAGSRHYRASLGRLREAIGHFNTRPLAFVVHLGDLIDRDWSSFDRVFEPLAGSRHPVCQVLGNHDFDVADALKPEVPDRLGVPQRHHYFDRGNFRFVILDTTEVSTYAHPEGSPGRRAGEAELERVQAAGLRQAQSWNSGIGKGQLEWFESSCRDAQQGGRRVVVFAHHPVLPAGVHNLWNDDALLQALARQPNVIAWFNGHNHGGALAQLGALRLITVPGMVETADTNAFAVVDLYPNRLVLTGRGRAPSHEWDFQT
jgi:manganese-dependent ADP-ribose/CDP-alcohol diphosphatase